MDYLYDMIKDIKDNNGAEYVDTPLDFFYKDKASFVKKIHLCADELSSCVEKKDLEGCIVNLLSELYYILDRFVEQGINPGILLSLIINDKSNKLWPDGEEHFDSHCRTIYPPNYKDISDEIDYQILSMKEKCYEKNNNTVSKYYNDILEYLKKTKAKCKDEPRCLKEKEVESYQYRLSSCLTDYLNCVFVEEEAEFLSEVLFETMKTFVLMGVNPEKLIEEFIEKERKESLKRKSK